MPTSVPSAEDEQSFLDIFKVWLREVPDLPPATDADFIRFGYETCDRIETSVAQGDSPQAAAQIEVTDAALPDGMIDGGKGDVLQIRLGLQRASTEYLCPDPNLQQWADQFEEAVLNAMQNLTDR